MRAKLFLMIALTTLCHAEIFESIWSETEAHKQHLSQIGLEERGENIRVLRYIEPEYPSTLDLSSFDQRTTLPIEVVNFDPKLKNTLIEISGNEIENNSEELRKLLDIRLYPTLRNLIRNEKLEIFLGSNAEMAAYYKKKGWEILVQFNIPSSATYYLALDSNKNNAIIMAGLVSRENMIAQLLTLKFADISLDSIEIIGEISHFAELVEQDIATLSTTTHPHILIIAGCGLREKATQLIYDQYQDQLESPSSFDGNIIHLTFAPFLGNKKILVLDLVYGEIMEKIVQSILEHFPCSHVFSCSAGGYIPRDDEANFPPIGSWIPIEKSMNPADEIVSLTSESGTETHLQIPSIFLETYDWLQDAKTKGSSVDVESFYILRAIRDYNRLHPNTVHPNCGYFVSDYVGKQPLRNYSKVYEQYPTILSDFLKQALKTP